MNLKNTFYKNIPRSFEESGYNEDKISFITSHIGTGLRILDIGCNDGYIGAMLLARGNDVYGVDITKHKVNRAIKRGIKAMVFDIESKPLPYENNFFDVVLLTDVIEHMFDTDQIFINIRKTLKKGGLLLVTTPNVASFARRIMLLFGFNPHLEYSSRYMDFLPGSIGHIRYYTHGNLQAQLHKCGFRQIRTYGDILNFQFFSSKIAAKIFPTFSVDILCTCTK